jgi:hypothetical protein
VFGPGREERAAITAGATYLQDVRSGLAIGKRMPVLPGLISVEDPSRAVALEGAGYDGVIWRLERPFEEGLGMLRPLLLPGARLFVLVELLPSMWGVTREILGGREIMRFSREGVCEALLLSGLLSPRVWVDSPRFIAVSAQMPDRADALDDVFAQPPAGRVDTST